MDVFMCIWAFLVPAVGSVHFPDITDRDFIDLCVKEHNRARSEVSPPATDMLYMSWDHALAVTAKAWSRQCTFKHNPLSKEPGRVHPNYASVGENLWVGTPPSHFDLKTAVQSWVDEKQDYTFNSNTCRDGQMCGHYTQVVWAPSFKVGCAVHTCPEGITGFSSRAGANFVCNYYPAGNVIGMKPYQTNGAPCSKCEDRCVDKLCRSNDRDTEKSYNRNAEEYVSILIIRPVALVCTFIAAVTVKHFYPDVFCYE